MAFNRRPKRLYTQFGKISRGKSLLLRHKIATKYIARSLVVVENPNTYARASERKKDRWNKRS